MAESIADLADRLTALLEPRQGKWTSSGKGERWLQFECPFHEDPNPSARWQPDTKIVYCHGCGRTYTPNEILARLGDAPVSEKTIKPLAGPPFRDIATGGSGATPDRGLLRVLPGAGLELGEPEAIYDYVFPDGHPSHQIYRFVNSATGKKTFRPLAPGARSDDWELPSHHWPFFGPHNWREGDLLLIVEGEKCVQAVEKIDDRINGIPIRALTWVGGANRAKQYADALGAYINQLKPAYVELWPDWDNPGEKAMEQISRGLKSARVRHNVVDVMPLGLLPKADVADFLERGKSLASVYQANRADTDSDVLTLIKETLAMAGYFIYPASRQRVVLTRDNITALWRNVYSVMPKSMQVEEVMAGLFHKGQVDPTTVYFRTCAFPDKFFWRPTRKGQAIVVSAHGIGVAGDPENAILLLADDECLYPADYEPGMDKDLADLCILFGLGVEDMKLLEMWLMSHFLGLTTPILFVRGPAGTGKTTLAKAIVSIIEPSVICVDFEARDVDARAFWRTLETNAAVLFDNISNVDKRMENWLSRIVTGTTQAVRILHTEMVDRIRPKCAMVLTTTSYDVYKSDLQTRMLAISTIIQEKNFRTDEDMRTTLTRLVPRVRGFIFSRCAEYYRQGDPEMVYAPARFASFFNIGRRLGYDVDKLSGAVTKHRRELVSQNDPWLDALAVWAIGHELGTEWLVTPKELARVVSEATGENVSIIGIGRWMSEKSDTFSDYGFQVEKKNWSGQARYRFSRHV